MRSLGSVSDREVWAAIRYLDPDGPEAEGPISQCSFWVSATILISSAFLILFGIAVQHLPATISHLH